ncbi:MAG: type II CAAX endopeptidase family protein [Oscillospiraceae bacterium]
MKNKNKITFGIIAIWIICTIIKYIEFIFIRTDLTFIGDNIITKISCIVVIIFALKYFKISFSDIGFKLKNITKSILAGLSLGILTFGISYGVEILILAMQGKQVSLKFFITNFALTGASNSMNISLGALLICIIVNIINVFAEEGLFRGLILKLYTEKYGFKVANLIQAFLFGIWHIVMVSLGLYDGLMDYKTAIIMGIGYVILAGILGLEWGMCVSIGGTLWVGISEHFFNNFIGNTLHVVTQTGVDELQIARIVLSNVLSLIIVVAVNYIIKRKSKTYKQ